jgi:hypothetical protein
MEEKSQNLGIDFKEIEFVTIQESKTLKSLKESLRKTFLPRTYIKENSNNNSSTIEKEK